MQPTLLKYYPKKVLLGVTEDAEPIYLYRPSWDCGWYWGFGYIGNDELHTHLNCLGDSHMFNNIKRFLPTLEMSDKDLWVFCEVAQTVYTLRQMADLLHTGGSRITRNPCQALLKKPEWYTHINYELIPKLIDEMYKALKL